jgi:exopolysaccharide biosynthesis protein
VRTLIYSRKKRITGTNEKIGILFVFLLILFSGCVTSERTENTQVKTSTQESVTQTQMVQKTIEKEPEFNINDYIKHIKKEIYIGALKQSINILEIKPHENIIIKPVLSFDRIFGYQKLSEMIKDKDAFAAINGGFHSVYGRPYGMNAIDGEFFTENTGKFPMFIFEDNKYRFDDRKIDFRFNIKNTKHLINRINSRGKTNLTVLYTNKFGSTNRTNLESINVYIEKDKITNVKKVMGESDIPKEGKLICIYKNDSALFNSLKSAIGEKISIENNSGFSGNFQVYECGSWLVRDSKVIAPDYDEYIGSLLNRDPRTAIGIKKSGEVVFITLDGRQKGHSTGLTAKEFASFLKGYGLVDAAMLDGGSSTEMIIDDIIVNKLSDNGRERDLAGGIIIIYR